jgi:hypothetical protein
MLKKYMYQNQENIITINANEQDIELIMKRKKINQKIDCLNTLKFSKIFYQMFIVLLLIIILISDETNYTENLRLYSIYYIICQAIGICIFSILMNNMNIENIGIKILMIIIYVFYWLTEYFLCIIIFISLINENNHYGSIYETLCIVIALITIYLIIDILSLPYYIKYLYIILNEKRNEMEIINRHTIITKYDKTNKLINIFQTNTCGICHEIFEKKDKIRILSCGHYYHIKCIDIWIKKNITCPFCRSNILSYTEFI